MTVIKKSKIGKISLLEETETDGHLLEEGNEITDVNVNDVEAPLMDDEKATPKASRTRWVALFLCCFSFFGTYFNSTLMQILQTYVMGDFGITLTEFNSINSFSAIPVMFLPFISGILIDRFGLSKIYVVAGFLSLAGYGIIAYGIFQRHFALLVVGTVISSLGDAPLNICKNAMLVKWFVGKELSFALGMALCVCRLGSSISSFFSPMIYTNFGKNLTLPFIVGVVISSISFINTICLVILDKKTDTENTNTETGGKAKTKAVGLKDLRRFSLIYFLMLFNIGFTYTAVFGFTSNAPDMIAKRFGFKTDQAGKLLTIIYICPLFITPTVGALTDKYGKRMIIILVGSFILVATHIGVLLLKDIPEGSEDKNYLIAVGLLAIGMFYSSYAAIIWPCVALVVTEKLTGLAFGLIGTFQTLLGVIYPLGLGYLHDHTEKSHGYYWYQVAVTGFGVLALVFALGLFISDQKNGGKLNKPGTKRKLSVRERVYSQLSTGG